MQIARYHAGRLLAIAAGTIAATAAIYVLTQDAIASGHWTTDDLLMPVLVALAILAAHLVGTALRDRALGAAAGFMLLALLATGLVVYTSVGRQARTADTEDAKATAVAGRILALAEDIKRVEGKRGQAESMLEAARGEHARECRGGAGKRCAGIKSTLDVYTAAIKGHDADISAARQTMADIGPVPVTDSKATRWATILAAFADDEAATRARLTRLFRLFEPVAYSLVWEIGALVSFWYGFGGGHGRRAKAAPPTANDNGALLLAPSVSQRENRRVEPDSLAPVAALPHPVIVALRHAGRPLSNDELARAMAVTKGEASKRRREVEGQLAVTRDGRHVRIALAS